MFHLFKRAAATVAAAAAGKVRLFIDTDGLPKTKDQLGDVVVLGNGIESITLIGATGLNKNYRILLQDGTFFDYSVADGRSIVMLAKVGTVGLVDTYRITFNDATTFDYTVTNARSIVDIIPPAMPGIPGATDTYVIDFNDGPNDSFIVYNGIDGLDGQGTPTTTPAQTVGDTNTAGTAGPEYANPDHVHAHGSQTNPAHHAVATTAANGFMSSTDKTKLDGIAAGAEVNQNAFSVITGNTGTASADAKTDTIAITGGTGISTAATDTPDGLVITNTGVTQFNGRTGNVTPQQADYDAFFTTPAEASAAAPVQSVAAGTGISVNQTTGNVVVTNAGVTSVSVNGGAAQTGAVSVTTPSPANAAPPAVAAASSAGTTTGEYALEDHTHAGVTSVNGAGGAVTVNAASVGLGNVRNPVAPNVHTVTPQTLNQTLTAAATMTIPANSLQAGDAFEIDVLFGTLVNTTAASNLEIAVFINGTQNAIITAALGTTAVAAPGRGGRALAKVVFRTVGAAGTALANGTAHVNNLANFASNQVAAQTVNTTANVTLDVRVRTSAATSTGTVQFAAIDQAT